MIKSDLLARVNALQEKVHKLGEKALKPEQRERAIYAEGYLEALIHSIENNGPVFGIEPWHPLQDGDGSPGEMLLRVKDDDGRPLSPYPAIMTFYHNGFTSELDTILCLCALWQFSFGEEKQVSINVSGRSLNDRDFIKPVLDHLGSMTFAPDEKIIFEIHESNAVMKLNPVTMDMFRKLNIGFAMDDVGLSMNDVFRLSTFENIADYIKLDRACVGAHPEDPRAMTHVMGLVRTILPNAQMVAEGIKSVEHAREIQRIHPNIRYVQGMHLPERDVFAREWKNLFQ